MRCFRIFAAITVAAVCVSSVEAGPVTGALFFEDPPVINKLSDRDNDLGYRIVGGVATALTATDDLEEGDFLLATLKVDTILRGLTATSNDINTSNSGGFDELAGVSVIKIKSKTSAAAAGGVAMFNFVFEAAALGEWTTITTAAGHAITPDVAGSLLIATNSSQNWEQNQAVATSLANATDGPTLWEFGFTAAGGAADNSRGEAWVAYAPGTFAGFANSVVLSRSTVNLALNVTKSGPAAAGIELLPTTKADGLLEIDAAGKTEFALPAAFIPQATQLQGDGGFDGFAGGGWGLASHTDFYIKPVPEPSSILLFGIGSLVLAGCGIRRRRRNAKLSA